MANVNRASYDAALRLVAAGRWSIDVDLGLVLGVKGQPFRRSNGCGYIQIKFRDALDYRLSHYVVAHRVIWESVCGPLADELTINHMNGRKDDNRMANLEAVSHLENVRHARRIGLTPTLRGEAHPRARLTAADAREIRRLASDGQTNVDTARVFGVSDSHVSRICRGESWSFRHPAD